MTHTFASGPTSATIGELHSSSLATKLNALREVKLAPSGVMGKVATKCPVGSVTNAVLFQKSEG